MLICLISGSISDPAESPPGILSLILIRPRDNLERNLICLRSDNYIHKIHFKIGSEFDQHTWLSEPKLLLL